MTAPPPHVVFERLAPDVTVPERSTAESAGYDVRAYLRRGSLNIHRSSIGTTVDEAPERDGAAAWIRLMPGDRALVPTGFRARLPSGFEAQIRVRSSLAWKRGLIVPNAPGTVDADYPDEWFVLLLNASPSPIRIEHGERIAQIVLNRFEALEWVEGEVGISTDRVGGLGSTGSG
jgi:dUTP pyrophosphatase